MKMVASLLVTSLIILIVLSHVLSNDARPQVQQRGVYIGVLTAVVVDCAPSVQDCRPRTEYYLVTDGETLRLDLTNATIQIPLNEYVGKPDKKIKVVGTFNGSVLKAELITIP